MFIWGTRKSVKWGAAILVAMLLLTGCQSKETAKAKVLPDADQLKKIERLNVLAEDMYAKAKQGDIPGSRDMLQQMGDQITQIRFEGVTTVEGMKALTDTVDEAKRVANAAKVSAGEWQLSAAKLRLATDSLRSANDPMWVQYYDVLHGDVSGLEKGVKSGNNAEIEKSFNGLFQHYTVIYPSLLISRPASDVEKMDSLVTFIRSQVGAGESGNKQIGQVIPHLRQSIDALFKKKETPAYMPFIDTDEPIWWTFGIGSVILAALAYSGWRLYQKDRGVITVRKKTEA